MVTPLSLFLISRVSLVKKYKYDYICISYSYLLNKDDICKLQKKAGPEDFLESAGVVFQMKGGEFQSEGGKDVLQLK